MRDLLVFVRVLADFEKLYGKPWKLYGTQAAPAEKTLCFPMVFAVSPRASLGAAGVRIYCPTRCLR